MRTIKLRRCRRRHPVVVTRLKKLQTRRKSA